MLLGSKNALDCSTEMSEGLVLWIIHHISRWAHADCQMARDTLKSIHKGNFDNDALSG